MHAVMVECVCWVDVALNVLCESKLKPTVSTAAAECNSKSSVCISNLLLFDWLRCRASLVRLTDSFFSLGRARSKRDGLIFIEQFCFMDSSSLLMHIMYTRLRGAAF